jgi:hypothetical protein
VPGVIAAVIDFLPDELVEEHAACRDPAMLAVGRETIAVSECAVVHHDPANSTARTRREVCAVAAFEVNDRRHGYLPWTQSGKHECVVLVTVRIRTRHGSSRGNNRRSRGSYPTKRAGIATNGRVTSADIQA